MLPELLLALSILHVFCVQKIIFLFQGAQFRDRAILVTGNEHFALNELYLRIILRISTCRTVNTEFTPESHKCVRGILTQRVETILITSALRRTPNKSLLKP